MRRIVSVLAALAVVAAMVAVGAASAFAFPTDPTHGQRVRAATLEARGLPPNPIRGQLVSGVAQTNPATCTPTEDVSCQP